MNTNKKMYKLLSNLKNMDFIPSVYYINRLMIIGIYKCVEMLKVDFQKM